MHKIEIFMYLNEFIDKNENKYYLSFHFGNIYIKFLHFV